VSWPGVERSSSAGELAQAGENPTARRGAVR
jgi:hypothetical protein